MATAKPGKLRQLFAKNVRQLRNNLGVSQEELAHRAKVHRTFMGAVERSEQNISIDNIEKIAKALEVKPHQLLMDERR
jgi:transcriptional regulator with XRE-family HTH domain